MTMMQEKNDYDRHVDDHRCAGKPCTRRDALWKPWMGDKK